MNSVLDSLENEEFDLDELISSHSEKSEEDKTSIEEFERGEVDDFEDYIDEDDEEPIVIPSEEDFEESLVPISVEKEEISINDFAQIVLSEIEKRKLPPTPKNYKIYFEELLISQTEAFQEELIEILNKENIGESVEDKLKVEDDIHKSLQLTEQILNVTSKAHTNLRIMKNIVYKRDQELNSRKTRDVIKLMKFDLNKLDGILDKQSESMKKLYGRSVDVVNKIHDHTKYDRTYGIYNRKHFVINLKNEIEKMKFFGYDSTVALLIPHKILTPQVISKKIASVILKTISKILKQESRHSDTVAYYGNNIFGFMMSHHNSSEAEDRLKKILHAFRESSLFVAGREVEIKVKLGVVQLDRSKKIETSLLQALEALKIANRDENKTYIISY
jgi:diguanylate cyclase (GGDEF)-like protein